MAMITAGMRVGIGMMTRVMTNEKVVVEKCCHIFHIVLLLLINEQSFFFVYFFMELQEQYEHVEVTVAQSDSRRRMHTEEQSAFLLQIYTHRLRRFLIQLPCPFIPSSHSFHRAHAHKLEIHHW